MTDTATDTGREAAVFERIEAFRRRRPRLRDEVITLAHGAGGKSSAALLAGVFLPAFAADAAAVQTDAAVVTLPSGERLAFSTDSYVVKPLRFPGGSVGHLAVHGTVNDLAMMGAQPLALSAAFVIEEGFSIELLRQITADMAEAAAAAGVSIVTGDTKVVISDGAIEVEELHGRRAPGPQRGEEPGLLGLPGLPRRRTASSDGRRHHRHAVHVAHHPVAHGHRDTTDVTGAPTVPGWSLRAPGERDGGREHREAVRLERRHVADAAVDDQAGQPGRLGRRRQHLAPVAPVGTGPTSTTSTLPAGAVVTATCTARLSPGVHPTG
jgi:hypothetical protein